jgi:hypothetical protein
MKKTLSGIGIALSLTLVSVPASARSLKNTLRNELFGGPNPFFLTVPNPAFNPANPDLPPWLLLLAADSSPTRLGKPISVAPTFGNPLLAIGNFGGGLGNVVAEALSDEILSESAVVPVPSGSAGFAYEYDPSLAIVEKKSIGLGTLFNERVDTLGKGIFAFGVAYVRQDFDEFNGKDISHLRVSRSLFANAPPLGFLVESGEVEATLDLDITTNSADIWAIYGATDWLDVSFLLPITVIDLRARSRVQGVLQEDLTVLLPDPRCGDLERFNQGLCRISDFTVLSKGSSLTIAGQPVLTNVLDETKTGVGDLLLRSKAQFFKGEWGAVGGLAEFILPTGNEDNFLGDGAFKTRLLLLYSQSLFQNRLHFHLNGGGKITTQTSSKDTLEYGSVIELTLTRRLSLVTELIGSWRVDAEGLPSNFIDSAFGFKANLFRGLILTAAFRIPLNDDGLRSDVIYLAQLEYDL